MKDQEQPKMYITQPAIANIERHMQSTYSGIGKEPMELTERISSNKAITSTNKVRKKFVDMSIEERLDYFLSQPFFAPRVKCEIRTELRKYVGYIQSIEDNDVTILLPGRNKEVNVQLEEIMAVNLFGF